MSVEWRDVAGYEGLYQVNQLGQVRSLDRVAGNGRVFYGRVLSPIRANGYRCVKLSSGGVVKSVNVHRLVALAFLPADPTRLEVNHINGRRDDNRLENLEWVTPSENAAHNFKHLGRKPLVGAQHKMSRPVVSTDIKTGAVERFESLHMAARSIGYLATSIWQACNGRSKSCAGRRWAYSVDLS